MSDTTIFLGGKRIRLSKALKAGLLYVAIDICLSSMTGLGQTLYDLRQEDWSALWTPQKVGWVLLQAGGILSSAGLMLKAYLSNSSKPTLPNEP